MKQGVELGSGLIAIGRPWGTTPQVPTEREAMHFLEHAYTSGIRFFDTAPSYGLSEQRLGAFLQHLTPAERAQVQVATKCGEHWDSSKQAAYTDHSFEALQKSIERSMQLLGQITILQLHKTTPELLNTPDVTHAFQYARELGISFLGASVSDPESASAVLQSQDFSVMQLPFNAVSPAFTPFVDEARSHRKYLLTNRPFQMGQVSAETTQERHALHVDAFTAILRHSFDGVVLTGTSNTVHLTENIAAFQEAQNSA